MRVRERVCVCAREYTLTTERAVENHLRRLFRELRFYFIYSAFSAIFASRLLILVISHGAPGLSGDLRYI